MPQSPAPASTRAPAPYAEAVTPDGTVRPQYAEPLAVLRERGLAATAAAAARAAARAGLSAGPAAAARPVPVDPVPRVFTAAEWSALAAGLAQRAAALDALAADLCGPRRTVAAGVVPEDVLAACPYAEPDLYDAPVPPVSVGIVGFDVIRGPDGRLAVLEDNVLTPGHASLPAIREVLDLWRAVAVPPQPTHDPLRSALRGMVDAAGGDGRAVLLGDEAGAEASFELRWLGRCLGLPVVRCADLADADGRLVLRAGGEPVGVVWQRTSEDRLRDDDGRPTELGATLLGPLRQGTVRVVNRIGSGVVDDKGTAIHLAAATRMLLGAELALPGVPTLDLGEPATRAGVLGDLDAHVVKHRTSAGGRDVVVGRDAPPAARAALHAAVRAQPRRWVAQPRIALSEHPTVVGGVLEPRPVDLRVFAVRTPAGYVVPPGGISRFAAAREGALVNVARGGGIKDVWVLPATA